MDQAQGCFLDDRRCDARPGFRAALLTWIKLKAVRMIAAAMLAPASGLRFSHGSSSRLLG